MGEEDDLDRIFQEKLFIRRRVPDADADKENAGGPLVRRAGGVPLADVSLNTPKTGRTENSGAADVHGLGVPREVSLDGIYRDAAPPAPCAPLSSADTGTARLVEEEFNRLRTAQLESLKLKSKIYRFIHSEIYRIDQRYAAKTRLLEEENKRLRGEVERMNRKFARYQEHVNTSILRLKGNVVAAMKEYKKRYAGGG